MKKILIIIYLLCFSLNLYGTDEEDIVYIKKLYQNKYYKEAVSELQMFIKKHTDSKYYYSALNILGNSYYILKKYNKAKTIFKTLKSTEFNNNAYFYLGMIALKENKIKQARENIDKIDEKNELRAEGTYFIGNYYYKKNNLKKAKIYFKKVFKYKSAYYNESLLKLGFIYYKNKNYMEAGAVLEEYIKKVKDSANIPTAYFLLAHSNEKMEDYQLAFKYYQKVEKNYKGSEYYVKSIYHLTKLYNKNNDYDNLKKYANKLNNTEYEKQGYTLLAESEYERKNYIQAEKIYEMILEKNKDPKIRYKLILSLMKQEKYNKALIHLEKIKETKYKSDYFYYTGFILHKQKKYNTVLKKLINYEKANIKDDYEKDILSFLAQSCFNLKKYNPARKYYTKLYKKENNKNYLYQLILIEYNVKNTEEAEKLFKEYKNNFPKDKEYKKDIFINLAQLYIEDEKYKKAEEVYKKYLQSAKDEVVLNNLIAVLLKQNKYQQMLIYLNKSKKTIENLYLKGVAYSAQYKYKKASEIYKQIIIKKHNKYTEKSYNKLIEALFSSQKYEEVIKYCSIYLEKKYNTYKKAIIDKKGLAYFKLKLYKKALLTYEELKKYPEFKDYAFFMFGEIYYNQKEYKSAKKSYKHVIQNFPKSKYHELSLYWFVNIAYQNKNYNEFEKYSKIYIKKYKNGEYLEELVFQLGDIYLLKNKSKSAIREYKRLFKITNDKEAKENIIKTLVKIYFDLKKYNDAMKWVKKSNDSSFKTLWLAIILEKQGKAKKSIAEYKKLLEDEKNGDKANYYIGSYYLKKKMYKKARKYLETVLDFKESEYKDDALLKIGLSYEEEGNYKRAVTTLMKIKLIYENSPFQDIVHLKIAENYEKLEDKEKAIKIYLEFFDKFKDSAYYSKITERLLIYYLNKEDKDKAEKYYIELKKTNKQKAKQYKKYFNS